MCQGIYNHHAGTGRSVDIRSALRDNFRLDIANEIKAPSVSTHHEVHVSDQYTPTSATRTWAICTQLKHQGNDQLLAVNS